MVRDIQGKITVIRCDKGTRPTEFKLKGSLRYPGSEITAVYCIINGMWAFCFDFNVNNYKKKSNRAFIVGE